MSSTLSLNELRDIIKGYNYGNDDVLGKPEKILLYLLNLLNLLFLGDIDNDYFNSLKNNLQKSYDDMIDSTVSSYKYLIDNIPNPRDMKYFQSKNKDDLKSSLEKTREVLGIANSTISDSKKTAYSSGRIINTLPGRLYDDDLEMYNALVAAKL